MFIQQLVHSILFMATVKASSYTPSVAPLLNICVNPLLLIKSWCFLVIQAGVHTSSVRSLRYGWLAYALGERTTPRLKQYSKIISVEGNLASGKGALAQKLADKLGNYLTVGSLC